MSRFDNFSLEPAAPSAQRAIDFARIGVMPSGDYLDQVSRQGEIGADAPSAVRAVRFMHILGVLPSIDLCNSAASEISAQLRGDHQVDDSSARERMRAH